MPPKAQSVVAKRQIGSYKQQALDLLVELGGAEIEERNVYVLDTLCGELHVKVQENWLQGLFIEPQRAAERIRSERYNPQTGKWLWSGRDHLAMFKAALLRIREEPLNISMDKDVFLARKAQFFQHYSEKLSGQQNSIFIKVINELTQQSIDLRHRSPKAAAFYNAPPQGKIEAMFRDVYPYLERDGFPTDQALLNTLSACTAAVWINN